VRNRHRTDNNIVYIMTNSMTFSEEETVRVHREITAVIDKVSKDLNQQYMIISRGDSTLRGHSYLEPKVLDEESEGGFDAVFYIPSFFEGGRYTHEGIHYLSEADDFIPVSESEF